MHTRCRNVYSTYTIAIDLYYTIFHYIVAYNIRKSFDTKIINGSCTVR